MAELTGAPVAAVAPDPPADPPRAPWALLHTAALTAATVALLLIGVLGGRFVLVGLLLPVQLLLVLAFLAVLDLSTLRTSVAIAWGAATAADLIAATGPPNARRLAGVTAIAFLAALIQQVLRRDPRVNLTSSLAATVTAIVFAVAAGTLIALRRGVGGRDAAVLALLSSGAAVVVARIADALRLRRAVAGARRRSVLGVVCGGGVALGIGAGLGSAFGVVGTGDGITIAAATTVVALACDIGIDVARSALPADSNADRLRAAVLPLSIVLPVAVAAPAAYVTGRLLLG